MACFLVPLAEAVVTTTVQIILAKQEKSQKYHAEGLPFSKKIGWLNKMLWGGSALLAFEHVWHGEIIPTFPFLTAVKDGNTAEMLNEMSRNGVAMALITTGVWALALGIIALVKKHESKKIALKEKI